MLKLTDEELIEEIRQRFESKHNALNDMRALTRKLESMNRKLQESEALKSHFLSNIRNEINNPLSAIMGLAAQFFEQKCDPDVCRKTARMIFSEAFNLDFQLQNIFMAAELEAGETAPAYSMVTLEAVINGAIDKVSYRAADKDVAIRASIPPDLIYPTDAHKFEIILLNLLANGVEFNQSGGSLDVSVDEDDQGLTMAVSDTGRGIAPKDQELIFDRFRQLEMGTTKPHRGHGLGLSICWSLAELLGGRLELTESGEQGSRFTLTLPRPQVDVAVHAKDANFFLFEDEEDVEQF